MDGLRLSIRVKDEFDAKLAQRIKLFSSILSEATRAIRRREGNLEQRCPWKSPVYIVAMAANAMQGHREKCLAAGMEVAGCIGRPTDSPRPLISLNRDFLTISARAKRTGSEMVQKDLETDFSFRVQTAVWQHSGKGQTGKS